jgi:hypothetical protein
MGTTRAHRAVRVEEVSARATHAVGGNVERMPGERVPTRAAPTAERRTTTNS